MKNNNVGRYGVVLAVVLFLIFVALKLTGVIAWSWWWISAPLWVPLVFNRVHFMSPYYTSI